MTIAVIIQFILKMIHFNFSQEQLAIAYSSLYLKLAADSFSQEQKDRILFLRPVDFMCLGERA